MRCSKSFVALAVIALAILAIAVPASAQTITATVAGTVKDGQGGVIPGATVTLISDTRGTKSPPVVTNTEGDFTFANVTADTYSVEVTMNGFKTMRRPNIIVNAGSRVIIGTLTIEVGGMAETVEVKGESPLIQAQSGERSFSIPTESVTNLPIANRSFTALALLAPGVTQDGNATPQRIGGGGDPNIMMDGVSTMDTGSNRPLLQMNVESIAEVKVLTSGYQAEFGRASGVQVTAITKSGTNRFRGSVYDVERNSDWNPNSKVNKINGDPKGISKQRDWGYSIGGPVGKPGGSNRLFFFYAQEFSPRTAGNDVQRYRVPTALERQGDFSQTLDQNGAAYPFMKDPRLTGNCTNADRTACFADGGVLGKIPASMLYQPGLNILNMWPQPTIPNSQVPTGQSYNFELTRPKETVLSWQPAIRVDYQARQDLRMSFKYSWWAQREQTFNGTLPGFNDAKMQPAPVSNLTMSVNYQLSPTMFLEGTYGHSQNELAGCAQAQSGTGPIFCQAAIPMNNVSSLANVGLQNFPFLFPNATVLTPGYYAIDALNVIKPPFWDGTRMGKTPPFSWGNRIGSSPPNIGFPGWFNINATQDFAVSLTKVQGSHTFKGGFYNTHSYKAEQTSNNAFGNISFQQDTVGTNPFDTSFGFANAAIGTFSSFVQAQKYVETQSVYNNTEAYIQDNWKTTSRLTFDYGMRFVHQQAQYDTLEQASNFLQDQWKLSAAPALYVPGCTITVAPGTACPTANRQAMNPQTGQFLGPNSTLAIATLVPNSGNTLNGLFLPGQNGLPAATYFAPGLVFAPRFGTAYDLTGNQTFVLRGGVGLYYDRPSSTTFSGGVNNPPTSATVTVRYGQLQALGAGGLTTQGAPSLSAVDKNIKIPTDTQWNAEIQMAMPWASSLSVAYVGHHSYNRFQGVNINMVDFGAAFLDKNQDKTLAPSTTPGAVALSTDLMRAIQGYGSITMQLNRAWQTYHSIQLSFQRRFRNGLSFGFNDTINLFDHSAVGARLQHNSDGTYSFRADQADAQELLGNNNPQTHIMRGNFIWDLPDVKSSQSVWKVVGAIVNDWQLSGIWAGSTASAYTVGFSYSSGGGNVNLTGSPDYGARIRVMSDPGAGCSSDVIRQFNQSAFQGPTTNSVGLESGNSYLRGCFQSALDLAIARTIRLPKGRSIQIRADMFNAPNSAIITGRNTTMNMNNPTDPTTATNLPYDANGNVIDSRSRPRGAGFGVVNNYQGPRNVQVQVRFQF